MGVEQITNLVGPDVQLPPAGSLVAGQQSVHQAEHLLHDGILSKVISTLSRKKACQLQVSHLFVPHQPKPQDSHDAG